MNRLPALVCALFLTTASAALGGCEHRAPGTAIDGAAAHALAARSGLRAARKRLKSRFYTVLKPI